MGSSSLITDATGGIVQHLEYIPFGEVFIDERAATSTWSTPYKFNAKELDEETGLYYYGARYYDPRTSVWISVDPLAEKYPNVGSYVYCFNNPVKFFDPDGKAIFYSRTGVYLGDNGADDKKVYLMNEGVRPRTENENINWGGKLDKSTSNQLMKVSTEVGGLIIQDRVEEGDDYTISEFKTVGGDENIDGFILEPAGPSTIESGKDRRILEGVYNLESYSSKKHPNNFRLFNKDVPKSRKILYHSGNKGSQTEGCNLPGTTKGKGSIGGSKAKMRKVRVFINSKGASKVKTIINNKIPNKK